MRRAAIGIVIALALIALAGCGSSGKPPHAPAPAPAPAAVAHGTAATRRTAPASHAPPASPVLVTHGPRTTRRVALTFDADMTRGMLMRLRAHQVASWYDARIVKLLRATRTPSTIFLTGLWTQTYPRVVRDLAADPLFELENHTVDHAGFERPCYGLPTVPSPEEKLTEIDGAATTIKRVAGRAPRFFRFPGGCHTAADDSLVAAHGETPVGWDVVSGDPFQPNPAPVARAVIGGARPGSIVVMHIVGAPNAPASYEALRTIIPALRAKGFRFVTLARLLRG